MSEQVQELIAKIKREGVQQAEQKAAQMEQQAKAQAEKIVDSARKEAERITAEALADKQKTEAATRAALSQAARDVLLILRQQINQMLLKAVSADIQSALSPDNLAQLIVETAKSYFLQHQAGTSVTVTLSEADHKALSEKFLAGLQKELKQPIVLRTSGNIRGGLTISFDEGKSCFDFTDQGLVDYFAGYLNADVAKLLQDPARE